jgi:hypothetical protein
MLAKAKLEQRLMNEISGMLARVLDAPLESVKLEQRIGDNRSDLVVSASGKVFIIEVKETLSPGRVSEAAKQVASVARSYSRRAVPLLVIRFMGETGRRACAEEKVAWFDLSGNARIVAPGLRVIIDGRPNAFRDRGKPTNLFAPKSARVVRWLLMHPDQAFTQRQIARSTDMTEGFVSRISARLEQEGYVERGQHRALRVRRPDLLLDAWREAYQFPQHRLHAGHVAARTGPELASLVGEVLASQGGAYAATGLAAAWQLTHFAGFRIATFFVSSESLSVLVAKLRFREDPRGANLWLVEPNDEGVFHGAEDRDGLRCVHPVQAYLDLKGHPERAPEAAEHLRAEFPSWKDHG